MRVLGKRLGVRRSPGVDEWCCVDEWCRVDLDSERGRRPPIN
jgi:hypothetical protein